MAEENDNKPQEAELYFPENKLAKVIRDNKGPALSEMEREAERRLKASGEKYQMVLKQSIARMKSVVASSETSVKKQELLFGEAHDIKGQAPLFDFPLVGEIAICICVAVRDHSPKLAKNPELLDLHVNALEWAFGHEHDESRHAEKSMLVASLKEALEKNE